MSEINWELKLRIKYLDFCTAKTYKIGRHGKTTWCKCWFHDLPPVNSARLNMHAKFHVVCLLRFLSVYI